MRKIGQEVYGKRPGNGISDLKGPTEKEKNCNAVWYFAIEKQNKEGTTKEREETGGSTMYGTREFEVQTVKTDTLNFQNVYNNVQ